MAANAAIRPYPGSIGLPLCFVCSDPLLVVRRDADGRGLVVADGAPPAASGPGMWSDAPDSVPARGPYQTGAPGAAFDADCCAPLACSNGGRLPLTAAR